MKQTLVETEGFIRNNPVKYVDPDGRENNTPNTQATKVTGVSYATSITISGTEISIALDVYNQKKANKIDVSLTPNNRSSYSGVPELNPDGFATDLSITVTTENNSRTKNVATNSGSAPAESVPYEKGATTVTVEINIYVVAPHQRGAEKFEHVLIEFLNE